MRKRKTTGLPPAEPETLPEVAEPTEEKVGVRRRKRIPQKEVTEALGWESTATKRLEKIVGPPPETEPADATTLRKLEGRFTDFNIIRDSDEIAERQDEGLHHLIKLREEVAEDFHDLDVKYGRISKTLEALPSRMAEEIKKTLQK